MNLVNENVEHIKFGLGVITKLSGNKIWVEFQDPIGIKIFLYPEAFEKFLKVLNPAVEHNVLEELRRKQEQVRLEEEQKEKQIEAVRLKEEEARLAILRKKSAAKSKKK